MGSIGESLVHLIVLGILWGGFSVLWDAIWGYDEGPARRRR